MKDVQKFWDKLAPRYARSPVRDEKNYQKKLAITQGYFQADWKVLEFGCGTGSTAIVHAPHVGHILATDISPKMLEIASQKAQDAGIDNIDFQQGTLETIDAPEGSFNAVLGLNILHLLPDLEGVVDKVYRLLQPGGIFVSSTALINEGGLHWRLLIPLLQTFGIAPYVKRLDKDELSTIMTERGFVVEYDWQPAKGSVFLIARKPIG